MITLNITLCVNNNKPTEIQRMVLTTPEVFQTTRNEYQSVPESLVATVHMDQHQSKEEAEKIAVVMAAAPELYHALRMLHNLLDFSSSDPLETLSGLSEVEISRAFSISKDALDKASAFTN